jgi:hypothetical protein
MNDNNMRSQKKITNMKNYRQALEEIVFEGVMLEELLSIVER